MSDELAALRRRIAELEAAAAAQAATDVRDDQHVETDGSPAINTVRAGRDAYIATVQIIQQHDPAQQQHVRGVFNAYLGSLLGACDRLSLADADSSDPHKAAVLLSHVFVGLEVTARVPVVDVKQGRRDEERQQTAIEALAQRPHIVLLGAPGSGKSTVVNYVALALARANLGDMTLLAELGEAWPHGGLLPIRALLREYAAWLGEKQPRPANGTDALFWEWVSSVYSAKVNDLLRAAAGHGQAVLLLDGLDEVPRDRIGFPLTIVRETILALGRVPGSRVVVTCRVLDYARSDRQLVGWPTETVIALNPELCAAFVPPRRAGRADREPPGVAAAGGQPALVDDDDAAASTQRAAARYARGALPAVCRISRGQMACRPAHTDIGPGTRSRRLEAPGS